MALENTGSLSPLKSLADSIIGRLIPNHWKHFRELNYWRNRHRDEGMLSHGQYPFAYLDHFGLTTDFYAGKRILDIGCGPRGSLEWATMAEQRVGLDPLAKQYLKMGADKHGTIYIEGGAENMPFPDAYFDVVCAFNALDHVDDVGQSLTEIARVTKAGGLFLLLVEINHEPTPTEPHSINLEYVLTGEFRAESVRYYNPDGGTYQAIQRAPIQNIGEPAIMSVKFIRKEI